MPVDTMDFVVRPSIEGKGQGLFALRDFEKGEYLLDYVGERITTKVADTHPSRYLFELDEEWTIDGEVLSNTARYINHACEPNVEADIVDDRIMISTLRRIKKGEEFLIDYGDEYFDEFIRPVGCLCGTKTCRKPRRVD